MASKVKNDKGFLVIKMSLDEAVNVCGFGYTEGGETYLIDANTNDFIGNTVYYVAALNDIFGEESYKEWYDSATYYEEDAYYENKHYEYYKQKLNLKD